MTPSPTDTPLLTAEMAKVVSGVWDLYRPELKNIGAAIEAIACGAAVVRPAPAEGVDDLKERLAVAERALYRHGYRPECDIPACNCGRQWSHGGNAATRLSEISYALGGRQNGRTLLAAIEELVAKDDARLPEPTADAKERSK